MTGENRQQTADDSRHKNEECIPQGSGHGARAKRDRMRIQESEYRSQKTDSREQTTDDRKQNLRVRRSYGTTEFTEGFSVFSKRR